ncbi:hypothetical protein Sipo8835_00710 [Streptomyces ipomoeae]|uniref:Uncharacterized protein n=1 Tax=Streptomyces ipomoeae TaxID=103232 RepID=A0AAE8W7F5_9ACTN|nr:hypothetical protein [Streptomyces ipomoeae]TQE40090.1 hypothetical protein Sipo8835_00710 [Streptomyces ipomoeae]
MDADDYARMTDEERTEFDRRRHSSGLVAAGAAAVALALTLLLLITFGDSPPMCGTGQDMGPC